MKILISYYYFQNVDLKTLIAKVFPDVKPVVFADSGAVTAYSKGKNLTVEQYGDWLLKNKDSIDVYANLDVKGDVKAGLRHQQHLEDLGLNPLPVFHTGEDFSILHDMIETYDYIALGGVAGHHSAKSDILLRWLLKCFRGIEGKDKRFHGFGISTWDTLRMFPWHSVDSSSWGTGFRYGRVPIFDPNKSKFDYLILGDQRNVYRHAHLIKKYGFSPAEFSDRDKNTRIANATLSALSYMKAEEWLWEYWKRPEPKFYMADSSTTMENFRLAKQGISLFLVESKTNMADVESVERNLRK